MKQLRIVIGGFALISLLCFCLVKLQYLPINGNNNYLPRQKVDYLLSNLYSNNTTPDYLSSPAIRELSQGGPEVLKFGALKLLISDNHLDRVVGCVIKDRIVRRYVNSRIKDRGLADAEFTRLQAINGNYSPHDPPYKMGNSAEIRQQSYNKWVQWADQAK